MLGFHSGAHELLRGLLELLFSRLRVSVSWTRCLVLDLDVDGLSVGAGHLWLLLLGLRRLVASIHCVVHHAPTVEGIVSLLLIFST